VAVVGVVGVAIGWLLASTIAPPVARLHSPPQAGERAPAPEEPSTERLRLAIPRPPVEPARQRNPFTFEDRAPAREHARGAAHEPARRVPETFEAEISGGPPSSVPTLAGIGVQGEAITAVLTDGTEVWIAKAGDLVRGHRVIDITVADVVLETLSGERVVLRLR
jgi:hypothetical protein